MYMRTKAEKRHNDWKKVIRKRRIDRERNPNSAHDWYDSLWRPIKFKGDCAIYARCKCGFYYPCYKGPDATFKVEIDPYKMYHYCPQCGARKKRYLTTIERLNRTQWE